VYFLYYLPPLGKRKKRSATTGCANMPSQSANSILEDWVMLIAILNLVNIYLIYL